MKKLLLLTAMSSACLNFNAEAIEIAKEDLASTTSTMKINWGLDSKAPITTGFFDKTLSSTTIDKETKLALALAYVTPRKEKYELFLEQIGSTYFRTKFLQDGTLNPLAVFMMSYFEEKLERLEKKYLHFQSYLEDISTITKDRLTANPIGTYSGKYRGDQAAQASYAHTKIKIWDVIFSFVDQYPITKISTSPIIQRAIEADAQKRVDAFGAIGIIQPSALKQLHVYEDMTCYLVKDVKGLQTKSKTVIDEVATQNPVRKLNDMINDAYNLKSYAEQNLKKWRTRIGEKEKINILGDLLKSLNVTNNELEEGEGKSLAIEWKNDKSGQAGK